METGPRFVDRRGALCLDDALPRKHRVKLEYTVTLTVDNRRRRRRLLTGTSSSSGGGTGGSYGGRIRTTVLRDVAGRVESGQLLAVLATRETERATLLQAISLRSPERPNIAGHVLVNNAIVTAEALAELSSFVHRQDRFLPTVTPREQLAFVAALTLREVPERQQVLVRRALREASLTHVADAQIGMLSAAERQRLAVAVECLSKPPLVFLDEPTRGLDASGAQSVVELLQRLAGSGHTIVANIEQPTSEVLEAFTHVHLLAPPGAAHQTGRTFFFGPRSNLSSYFESVDLPLPAYHSPTDYCVRAVREVAATRPELLDELCGRWDDCAENVDIKLSAQAASSLALSPVCPAPNNRSINPHKRWIPGARYRASPWTQLVACYGRAWRTILRDPVLGRGRAGLTLVLGVFLGTLYWWSRHLAHDKAVNLMGGVWVTVVVVGLMGFTCGLLVYPDNELPAMRRECVKGWFGMPAYFLARTAAEWPAEVASPLVFGLMMFSMAGFHDFDHPWRDTGKFLSILLALAMTGSAGASTGLAVGALCKRRTLAVRVGVVINLLLLMLGGFSLNPSAVPPYWKWLRPWSFYYWGFRWTAIQVFKHRDLNSSAGFESGDDVLAYLNVYPGRWRDNILALVALAVGWRGVLLFVLARITHQDRANRRTDL